MAEETIKPPKLNTAPSGGGGSFLSQHKGIVIGGVIILVGGAIFLFRKKSSSSSTVTPNTATPQVVYPTSSGGGTSSAMTGYGAYNSLASSLAQNNQMLSAQLTALRNTLHTWINSAHAANNPGGATPGSAPPQPASFTYGILQGSGYTGSKGTTYVGLSSWTQGKSIISAGGTLFWEPAQGVFQKSVTHGKSIATLRPNTTQFALK